MQATLEDFFKALRGASLTPTLDSELDASRAVALIGWSNRALLQDALGTTLAKSIHEREVFDATFARFFMFEAFSTGPADADATSGQADDPARADAPDDDGPAQDADRAAPDDTDIDAETDAQPPADGNADGDGEARGNGDGGGADGGGNGGGGGGARAAGATDADALANMLLGGDQAALVQRLTRAAREVGVTDVWLRTQRGWYTQRIQQAMGSGDLNRALAAAQAESDAGRAARLGRARDRLFEEVRNFVQHQIDLYAGAPGQALHEEFLRAKALSAIERRDLPRVREIVAKIARKLAARHARRNREQRRGVLDVRRTVRRNAAFGGVMFEPVWRSEVVDRPRVVVICDVSGSVSAYARFLLLFVYSLQELLSDLRSHAFIADLVDVSALFDTMPLERAIDEVMNSVGGSGSDYGRMLEDVEAQLLPGIDRRTTVLILGDARNNRGEPRVDLLEAVHRRARRVIWLNPESRTSWGYGDSEMLRYQVHCDLVRECRTLNDLERVLDDLLRQPGGRG